MTQEQQAAALARCEAATPGPHEARFVYRIIKAVRDNGLSLGLLMGGNKATDWADADLWANSQGDIRMALAEIARLRGIIAELPHGSRCEKQSWPRTGDCNCAKGTVDKG